MDVVLKTSINTRAPLHERVPVDKQKSNAASLNASTTQSQNGEVQINPFAMASHRIPFTTYDKDYTPNVIPNSTTDTTHGTLNNDSNNDHKSQVQYQQQSTMMMMKTTSSDDNEYSKQNNELQTNIPLPLNQQDTKLLPLTTLPPSASPINAAADDATKHTSDVVITHYPSSQWQSESHAASRVVQPVQCLDFYARARRVEQVDDDRRGALVGNVQRSLQIRNKRACDPVLRPPIATYQHATPASLSQLVTREKFGTPVNYLDLVQCKHRHGRSEYLYGFHDPPTQRLHAYNSQLSCDVPTQRKALTGMSTSQELFAGTSKATRNKPPGYSGFIPHTSANLAAMRNNRLDVDYAVSSVIPANIKKEEHGMETEKTSCPPHMGITMTDLNDPRRNYSKAIMTLAVHGGGVDPSVAPNALKSRHRTGKYARAPQMLKPKTRDSINQTVEGKMLQCTISNVTREQQTLNVRDDNRSSAYF